jgi:PAS domain S-box-containing protein
MKSGLIGSNASGRGTAATVAPADRIDELCLTGEELCPGETAPEDLTLDAALRNLHQLQVAQHELEIQNEELRRARLELEVTNARYLDLFEQAPVGYLSLGTDGVIVEANLTAAAMIGMNRGALIGLPFGRFLTAEGDAFLRRHCGLGDASCRQKGELRLGSTEDGSERWVQLFCAPSPGGTCRVTLTDSTELRRNRDQLGVLVKERTEELENRNARLEVEIAERKRAEEALSRSEQSYRAVVEDQTELISRQRPDGSLTFANQACCRFFGKTEDQVVGGNWRPNVIAADLPAIEKRLGFLAPDNPVVVVENRVISGSGEVRWMQFVNRGFFNEQGELQETQTVGRDITERKLAEQMLLVYADEVQDLYNNAPCGYHSLDQNGCLLRINDTELNWLGYTRNEVIGVKRFPDLLAAESAQRFSADFARFLAQGQIRDLEYQMVRKDGSSFPVIFNAEVQRDAEGRYLMSRSTVFDNTERKKVEQALQKSELQFRQMADAVGEVFWLTEPATGRALYLSPAFERIWGRPCAEVYANPRAWNAAILPEYLPQVLCSLEALGRGETVQMEYRIRRPDGTLRWISDRGYPLEDGSGVVSLVTGVASDITERKLAEEDLKRYAGRLIVLEEDLRKRIAMELHDDIGQVLTALGLNLAHIGHRLQQDSGADLGTVLEDSRMLTKEISRSVRNLMVDLRPTQLDEYGLAAAIRSHVEQYAQRTGIAVSVQADPDFPRLDPKQEIALFRISQEALNNVSKHAGATRVGVFLGRRGGSLRLSISDDGRGFQAGGEAARPVGSGWGLAIMRERAELAGGSFRVDSVPGQGTTVAIEIRGEG